MKVVVSERGDLRDNTGEAKRRTRGWKRGKEG